MLQSCPVATENFVKDYADNFAHLLELLVPIVLISLVEHLLEMLDSLVGEVVDVGEAPARDESDLQIAQPIQRCRVWDGESLENTWWVAWSGESHLLFRE